MGINRTLGLVMILAACALAACGQKGALDLPLKSAAPDSSNEHPKVNQAQQKNDYHNDRFF